MGGRGSGKGAGAGERGKFREIGGGGEQATHLLRMCAQGSPQALSPVILTQGVWVGLETCIINKGLWTEAKEQSLRNMDLGPPPAPT